MPVPIAVRSFIPPRRAGPSRGDGPAGRGPETAHGTANMRSPGATRRALRLSRGSGLRISLNVPVMCPFRYRRALLVGAPGGESQLRHGVEDAPMHRLEAVAHVVQRALHVDAHRVVDERLAHLLFEDSLEDPFAGGALAVFGHGSAVRGQGRPGAGNGEAPGWRGALFHGLPGCGKREGRGAGEGCRTGSETGFGQPLTIAGFGGILGAGPSRVCVCGCRGARGSGRGPAG